MVELADGTNGIDELLELFSFELRLVALVIMLESPEFELEFE